jgi:hypothetical protein
LRHLLVLGLAGPGLAGESVHGRGGGDERGCPGAQDTPRVGAHLRVDLVGCGDDLVEVAEFLPLAVEPFETFREFGDVGLVEGRQRPGQQSGQQSRVETL